MIRHRPAGLGHPYRDEADQRVPIQPVAGEAIELRATTPRDTPRLDLEIEINGAVSIRPLERFDPWAAPEAVVDESHLAAAARGLPGRGRGAWRVRLDPLPAGTRLAYRFLAGDQRSRDFEVTIAGWTPDAGALRVTPGGSLDRLEPGSLEWLQAEAGPIRARFALRLDPGSHVIGFGERFDSLDQAGRKLDAVVFEQYKGQGGRSYLPVPFAIVIPPGGRPGWGFWIRTTRRTWYDVGRSDEQRIGIEVALDPAAKAEVGISLYDGTPGEVLAAFLAESGPPALPPDWIFAPWMSGNEWNTEARIRAEVQRSLSEGIPVGVVVIEAWSDEATFAVFRDAEYSIHPDGGPHRLPDFRFPPEGAWPDPKGLTDWLHEHGVRLVLWQAPFIRTRPRPSGQAAADLEVMVARGYGVAGPDGRPYRNRAWWFPGAILPDWTNPEARDWWLEKRRYLVEDLGVDGFKTDGGEHAWGDDLRYADGTRGAETNNRYPGLYAAAYQDLLRACGRHPLTFSRSGFTGAAAVPAHWAGDESSTWEGFRASITAGLSAGASGIFFWGWDLGGFSGEIPSAELYLRAAAMACFCPVMQYHSEYNHHRLPSRDRTPWNIAERTGDELVLPAFRRLALLRERLRPYLAEQAARSVERSLPMMRALAFEWPADPAVWGDPYTYLLGDDLLVSPITEAGATEIELYLPLGDWIDAWTGTEVSGPTRIRRDVPIGSIAVHVRRAAWHRLRSVFADPALDDQWPRCDAVGPSLESGIRPLDRPGSRR
ncbi:MAG: glycoside hydrolase family 31 [Chloroflexi bacterium]|nr:glycoside hydrolase family 31 [Chloroflexota bacterium]